MKAIEFNKEAQAEFEDWTNLVKNTVRQMAKVAHDDGYTIPTTPIILAPQFISLKQRCDTTKLPRNGKENPDFQRFVTEAKTTGKGFDVLVARYFRKLLTKHFPEVKFKITSGGAGYLNCVNIRILSSPYGRKRVFKNHITGEIYFAEKFKNSSELQQILDYAQSLHDSFDIDDGDDLADYGSHHYLYGNAEVDYNYQQTKEGEKPMKLKTPCNIGDTIYFVNINHPTPTIEEFVVNEFRVAKLGLQIWVHFKESEQAEYFFESSIGKNLFLDKLEAQRKLDECNNDFGKALRGYMGLKDGKQ